MILVILWKFKIILNITVYHHQDHPKQVFFQKGCQMFLMFPLSKQKKVDKKLKNLKLIAG